MECWYDPVWEEKLNVKQLKPHINVPIGIGDACKEAEVTITLLSQSTLHWGLHWGCQRRGFLAWFLGKWSELYEHNDEYEADECEAKQWIKPYDRISPLKWRLPWYRWLWPNWLCCNIIWLVHLILENVVWLVILIWQFGQERFSWFALWIGVEVEVGGQALFEKLEWVQAARKKGYTSFTQTKTMREICI